MHYTLRLFLCLSVFLGIGNKQPDLEPTAVSSLLTDASMGKMNANNDLLSLSIFKNTDKPVYKFPYQLDKPDATHSLSSKLLEISALSLSPDDRTLLAVNDEEGKLFYVEKSSGKILRTVQFGQKGDYEGVEAVGSTVYAVTADGDIFKLNDVHYDKPKKKIYETKLSTNNDVEGLTYDPATKHLLLACKKNPLKGDEMEEKRAVYAFDLNTKAIDQRACLLY